MNYKLKVSMNKYTLCFDIQCISKSITLEMISIYENRYEIERLNRYNKYISVIWYTYHFVYLSFLYEYIDFMTKYDNKNNFVCNTNV